MIRINKSETKDVYLTLSEKQTLVATTMSTVYYLFEAESNDTNNSEFWYSDDLSTNVNRYNKFAFQEMGTFSANGLNNEFSLIAGSYDYRAYETLFLDFDVDNTTSCLETGLMKVVDPFVPNNKSYDDTDDDTNYVYNG